MFKLFWVWDSEDSYDLETLNQEFIWEDPDSEIWQVALDVVEKNDSIIIIAPIAWIDLNDVDLSIKKNILTISWVRKKPENYYEWSILRNLECFWWDFVRNIVLPENVDFDNIKAIMDNNILVVNIPKINLDTKNIKINRIIS